MCVCMCVCVCSPYRYGSSPAALPSSPPSLASIPDRRSISCENACVRGSVQYSVRRYALGRVHFSCDFQSLCTYVHTHPRPIEDTHTRIHTHTHTTHSTLNTFYLLATLNIHTHTCTPHAYRPGTKETPRVQNEVDQQRKDRNGHIGFLVQALTIVPLHCTAPP